MLLMEWFVITKNFYLNTFFIYKYFTKWLLKHLHIHVASMFNQHMATLVLIIHISFKNLYDTEQDLSIIKPQIMGHSMPNHPKSEKFPGWPSQILMKIGSNAHLRIWWPHAKKFCHLAISFIFIVTYIQGVSFLFLTHDVEFEWLPVLKWW